LQPVTESSLLVTWFTRECGKLKTLAKGARRPKSPLRGKIDLFYHDEILFLRSRRSDLHLLQDCFLEFPHKQLRESVDTLVPASYVCELVEIGTEPEDPNPRIFDLLGETLAALERTQTPALLIWFELQLLAAAGWAPKWERSSDTTKLLGSIAGSTISGAQRIRLAPAQLTSARRWLWRFWDEHIGKPPRSRRFLRP
jgi:DNA repair protein RecO (recombination protein O)